MTKDKFSDNLHRIPESERDRLAERILGRMEVGLQKLAYRALVVRPMNEFFQTYRGNVDYPAGYLEAMADLRIREAITEWLKLRSHLGNGLTIDQLLYTVSFNPRNGTLEIDQMSEALRDMETGSSTIRLYYPTNERLAQLVEMEYERENTQ